MCPSPAAAAAPPALAPPPGHPRFPLFDALRALAALSVVVAHTSGVSAFSQRNALGAYTGRLDVGVTVFFLISGFLLYRPFAAWSLAGARPVGAFAFWRRRILRIVPAYWVALTVLAAAIGLPGVFGAGGWRFYGFAQIYSRDTILDGISPAWTLCIEMTFYALLPLYALALRRLVRGRRARDAVRLELCLLAVLAAASVTLRTVIQAHGGGIALNTLPTTLDWFALGMGLAVLSVATAGRERAWAPLRVVVDRPWLPWLGAAVCFWAVSTQLGLDRSLRFRYTTTNALGLHLLYGAVAFLVLLPAVFGDAAGGAPRRLLASRALAWLGLVSYGIYLWHAPLIAQLWSHGAGGWLPVGAFGSITLVALAAAIACGAASYYVVERPALRLKDRRRGRRDAPPAAPRPAAELAGRAG